MFKESKRKTKEEKNEDGNISFDGRIEQYVIDNDKKIFEFTENWIKEIKEKMKNHKDFKIVN